MDGLKPGENFSAWNTPVLTHETFWGLDSNIERYEYLCRLAHLAPSAHNTQPWVFSLNEDQAGVEFFLEPKRVLPHSDQVGRQAIISIGCAIANFELAAKAFGAQVSIEFSKFDNQVIHNDLEPIKMAVLKISHKPQVEPSSEDKSLHHAIFTRRVDRGEYDHDKKMPAPLAKKIEELGQTLGVKTVLISDWGRRVALAELQAQADSFVVNNHEFAAELINEWLLENDTRSGLGMPGDTFRLSDEQTLRIKSHFAEKKSLDSDDLTAISQLGKKGILSCQCVGMLIVENNNFENWLNVGRVLEHGALVFESEGMGWAVHAGLAEVSQVNMFMLRPIAMTTKRPLILFRAGYLKTNEQRAVHSPRLNFSEVWIKRYGAI